MIVSCLEVLPEKSPKQKSQPGEVIRIYWSYTPYRGVKIIWVASIWTIYTQYIQYILESVHMGVAEIFIKWWRIAKNPIVLIEFFMIRQLSRKKNCLKHSKICSNTFKCLNLSFIFQPIQFIMTPHTIVNWKLSARNSSDQCRISPKWHKSSFHSISLTLVRGHPFRTSGENQDF